MVYKDHIVLKASHINFSLHVSEKMLPKIVIPLQRSIYRKQEPLLRAFRKIRANNSAGEVLTNGGELEHEAIEVAATAAPA